MGYATRGKHYGWPAYIIEARHHSTPGLRVSITPRREVMVSLTGRGSVATLTAEDRHGLLAWLKEQFSED